MEADRSRAREAIEAAGFSDFRSFATMERSLADPPPAPPLLEGIRVTPWRAELDASTCEAYNDAFADHWGSLPRTQEMWRDIVTDSRQFRPDLSYLAVADDRVVAFCICEVDQDHNESFGVAEVYIELVGTVREFRGHGLASHLIVRSLEQAALAGLDVATLTVDEMSHTRATEVYKRLGFAVRNRTADYYLEVASSK
jgi:mycothiol synthase